MFRNLKIQLLVSSLAALALLLLGVWFVTRGFDGWAIVIMVALCIYLIVLNLWFWRYVTDPIAALTDFAKRIAQGSYGSQIDDSTDNEIGRLTAEINDMSEKVAVAEKSRTEFISQVSHELRTPLTAIMGWSETIAYDEAVQGDSLRGIHIISKEAERLTGMVSELLEFTRIQDGRFNLRIELIDIAAELEDALFTYGELMRQAGVEFNYSGPPAEIPLIPGDPERLKQVFLNVLDNAVNHGGEGKKVDVALSAEADGVHISVRDYGHGIPEGELAHVKEKFYKGSSKNRGTGIGLAVCDEIISRHNGALKIENASGGGCVVKILLPLGSN
ncbi:MAG: HAMP domain-containing histidine kinase [Firmicutes bacterium]|nr:HAMP domain-containing histidine kinase [Bacillota bacterium]